MSLFSTISPTLASFTPIDVSPSQPQEPELKPPVESPPGTSNTLQMRNVYISGLPSTMRAAEFREMCQAFGRVEASKLCVDNNCQPTKGYGFALFYDEGSAKECIRSLNGHIMSGRSMQARLADTTATPAPLDPGSAHPPISRDRVNPKGRQRVVARTSLPSEGSLMITKNLAMSVSPSSQDVTPTMTPPQLSLAPAMLPTIAAQQPLMYHPQMEQSVGFTAAGTFPAQHTYTQVSPHFMPSPMMSLPIFFTLPPSNPAAASVQPGGSQPYVYPSVVPSTGGYPQQFFSPVVFQSP